MISDNIIKRMLPLSLIATATMMSGCMPISSGVTKIGSGTLQGETKIPKGAQKVDVKVVDLKFGENRYNLRERNRKSKIEAGEFAKVEVSRDTSKVWSFPEGSKIVLPYKGRDTVFKASIKDKSKHSKDEGTLSLEH